MTDKNNYQPKTPDTKYDSFSKALTNTRDELGALILKASSEKGNSIEFAGIEVTIKPGNFKVKD